MEAKKTMEEIQGIYEPSPPKKVFSRVGWAFFTVLAVVTALQIGVAQAVYILAPEVYNADWFIWALSFVPLYLIAFPLGFLVLKKLPAEPPLKYTLGAKQFFTYLLMGFALMYIGNIIGSIVTAGLAQLTKSAVVNPINDLLMNGNTLAVVIVAGLLAPVFEELVFRKLLIDRILKYGEGTAILVSGLLFGLFHGNLSQFFYAFALGSLFAFIYIRTGRVRNTIFLHMGINFVGGVLGPLVLKGIDMEKLSNLGSEKPEEIVAYVQANLPQMLGFGVYMLGIMAMFIVGLILLIEKRKEFKLYPTAQCLEKHTGFKTVFLNPGICLFVLLSLGVIGYTVFSA